jgi:hypothetical protein
MKLSICLKLEYIYGKVIGSRNQWYQLKAHWVPVVKSKRPTIKLIHMNQRHIDDRLEMGLCQN